MFFQRVAICLACVGMVGPPSMIAAEQPVRPTHRTDISLGAGGTLNGTVVNASGRPQAGVPVSIRFGGLIVAQARTNQKGRFAFSGLRAGVHDVVTPGSRTKSRLWSGGDAPRSAKTAVVLNADDRLVRAQDDGFDSRPRTALIGGLAVAGTILGIALAADRDSSGPTSP